MGGCFSKPITSFCKHLHAFINTGGRHIEHSLQRSIIQSVILLLPLLILHSRHPLLPYSFTPISKHTCSTNYPHCRLFSFAGLTPQTLDHYCFFSSISMFCFSFFFQYFVCFCINVVDWLNFLLAFECSINISYRTVGHGGVYSCWEIEGRHGRRRVSDLCHQRPTEARVSLCNV